MENYKIKVNNESESKEVQELFFELGYKKAKSCRWLIDCIIDYFATDGDDLHCWDSEKHGEKRFNSLPHKQVTIEQLRDLVVLKRNSIDGASFKDTFGDIWYMDSTNSYWMFENGIWCEAEETLFKLEPIKKPIENEVRMKEYLDSDYELRSVKQTSGDNHVPSCWIEVPEGAEILYFDKRYEPANHFFKTVNGKSYYRYLKNGTKWMEYSDKGLNGFKENIDNFRIMWQRNNN